jgi:hypothetical protein
LSRLDIFIASVSAATTAAKADHFEITINPTAKVAEALDIGVKAVDKAGLPVKTYLGTVYITVENDTKATVPYEEGYTFVTADQGAKTFSKGLTFSKEGKMKVTVVDIDTENLEGTANVTVSASTGDKPTAASSDISILSPSNGDSIPDTKTTVSGTAKKNSKIQIFLNNKKMGDVQSDDAGNFLFNVKTLESDQNILQAKLLDGTDKVVGESEQVSITVSNSGPSFKSIVLKEGTQVSPGTLLNVTVTAEANLKEVLVTMNGVDQIFSPSTGADYIGTLTAPTKIGDYPIKVKLANSLGKTTTKDVAETLKVIEAQPVDLFKNIKTEKTDKKVTFTFELIQDNPKIAKFKFKYGTSTIAAATNSGTATDSGTTVDSGATTETATTPTAPVTPAVLDKENISFDKAKMLKDGKYTWYIDNLTPAAYTFELYALDKDGKELPDYNKATTDADLSLLSAGKCNISNIGGLTTVKNGDVSELTWNSVPEAKSYNVYKKDAEGKWQFIENVATNKYTIHIGGDKVVYEDFAIK